MRSPISPPDLQVLLLEADVAARRLSRKLRLLRKRQARTVSVRSPRCLATALTLRPGSSCRA